MRYTGACLNGRAPAPILGGDLVADAPKQKLPKSDETFLAELARCGSKAALARAYGCVHSTVHQRLKKVRKRRPDLFAETEDGKEPVLIDEATPELQEAVWDRLRGKPKRLTWLTANLGATPEAVVESIDLLRRQGYEILCLGDEYQLMRVPFVDYSTMHTIGYPDDRIIRFGACSDSHYGSKAQQRTALHKFYALCEQLEIRHVFNSGDLVAGVNMYPEQPYEVYLHGADEQVEAAIADYPTYPGCETHMIGGNHDASFIKAAGHDIFRRVQVERPDINFLGWYEATVEIDDRLKVRLWHPKGGVPYAKSYRIQRLSEGIAHGPNIPHVILYGHLHSALHMEHLGMQQWLIPCCEGSTAWTRRLGLIPCIGGYIITILMDEAGKTIEQMSQQLIRFPELEKDWAN